MVQNQWDPAKTQEWQGKPGTVAIPAEPVMALAYEVIAFPPKKSFMLRCATFQYDGAVLTCTGVIKDTSKLNAKGEVVWSRFTYYPWVRLGNMPCLIVPAPEKNNGETEAK